MYRAFESPPAPEILSEKDRCLIVRRVEWMCERIERQLKAQTSANGNGELIFVPKITTPVQSIDRYPLIRLCSALASLEDSLPSGSLDELRAQYTQALQLSRSKSGDPRKFYEQQLAWARVFEPLQTNGESESC